MNIKGLDYNTQRDQLVMPEYGREIQKMVEVAVSLPTKDERMRCAKTIIRQMENKNPMLRENAGYEQTLWDHLFLMSHKQLDIDWPYDVSGAQQITAKPEPLGYPMTHIPVRHYGKMMFEIFEKLKTMPAGEERDELVRVTANQMKQNLYQWSHGSADDEKVISDMARFTDGKIQIDIDTFKFDKIQPREPEVKKKGKRR